VTRVRKVTAVSLMTPMVAAAIAFGVSRPASAVEACPPLASATINAPTGTVAVGSTVHVSAQISGLMLFEAHLQVSGPGLNAQVGNSVMSGSISGNVTVPQSGTYTLAVIGNGTKCTYKSTDFTAKQRASASPTQSAPGRSPRPGGAGGNSGGNGAVALPKGNIGGGSAGGNNYGLPFNSDSPYSLPPVAPDGSSQGFAYPTPEPQVASPPAAQPAARSVAETTPVKWGQSLAIALVLLVISAHLGMWSRHQRLAAEGARSTNGGGNRRRAARSRKRSRGDSATVMAATATASAPADASRTDASQAGSPLVDASRADMARTDTPLLDTALVDAALADSARSHAKTTRDQEGDTARTRTGQQVDADTEPIATNDFAGANGRASAGLTTTTGNTPTGDASANDASTGHTAASAEGRSKRSGGRGYHGRRRRD
jgi:hypothetical protein